MTARTVIQSNGRPRRMALSQPPHFRKGQDAAPPVDKLIQAIDAAIRSVPERRSTGKRTARTK